MKAEDWDVLIISGLVIGIIGCFLPWGRSPTYPYNGGLPIGAGLLPGIATLFCLLSGVIFQLFFILKREMYMTKVVLTSGLVALLASGAWILPLFPFIGSGAYTVLYGAYVTLLGAMGVSGITFLYIITTTKEQSGLDRSTQKI